MVMPMSLACDAMVSPRVGRPPRQLTVSENKHVHAISQLCYLWCSWQLTSDKEAKGVAAIGMTCICGQCNVLSKLYWYVWGGEGGGVRLSCLSHLSCLSCSSCHSPHVSWHVMLRLSISRRQSSAELTACWSGVMRVRKKTSSHMRRSGRRMYSSSDTPERCVRCEVEAQRMARELASSACKHAHN